MEQQNNSGVLFQNNRKVTDKHPDYTGSCTINGKKFWLNGWINESKGPNPKTYLKLSVKEQEQHGQENQDPRPEPENDNQSLPF